MSQNKNNTLTAMNELMAYCEQQAGVVASEDYRLALEDVVSWCQRHYLGKEKEQIVDAYEVGDFRMKGRESIYKDGEDYYNQEFVTNEKEERQIKK